MEEDALQDAWNLSLAKGFKGSKEDFTKLLQSNNDFFNLSFNTFKEKDFDGDEEAYSNLLGIQRPQPSEESGTPSPLVEQELPVGVASREELISNIKDPYIKRQEQILLDASIERKKLVDELPIQDVRQKMMDSYEPLLQQKRQELQDSLDRGEIDANKANEGLNSYYEKVNTQVNQKLQTNFKLNEELKKVNENVNDKAFKELNIVVKDKQAAIDLAYQEQIDQLSPLESIGNALYNSALMTSLIPAKTILLGEQLSEDFTVSLPIALYGILSGQDISDKTKQLVRGASQSVTQQQAAYKEIQDTEEKLKPTLPFLESLEKGEIDKASAAAVGTAVDFLRSMVTSTATMGMGTFGEIGAPMYMEAVRAKAKETGKKEEDIIAEDLEDETTALLSAGLATASEFYGLGTAANLMRNSIFKAGVKDQVKKNIPKLVSLGKDISVASLKESGTEIFQQSVEKANKAALENGGIKTDEGRKAFLKESFNATFTKDAAETGASTFAGSMLLFGMGKGAASLRKTKAVIDKPTQELTDEEIKEVLNSKGDLEQLTEKIKGMYQSGALTEEGYNISQDKINRVLKYDSELSPTNNNREESIRLLAEREKLEAEMGSLHPTQRGGEQAKIAVIDKKLTELATEGIATKETTTEETTAEQRLENRTKEQENLFGDQHKDKRLPYGAAEISDITTTDKNGVTTATYVNPETKSVDAIITATNEGNFVGYVRVYENGKPTNMFSAKMQTSESGVFKNIITSAENALPNNVEVVETTTISKGGLRTYNKSRLVEKVDEDGNVVTRPTKYSAATKESLEEKGESAFNEFSTPVKSEAETELAEVKKAYPGINATITKKGLTYKISIDLPVLVKPVEMQKTTEETTKEAEGVPNKDVSRLTDRLSGGEFNEVDAGFGEKGYNYTTPDGVEVTLREDNDVVDINGQEVQGDIQIDFIGVDKNRGEGLASKELKNILDAADESDMSVSLIVDSKGATETKQGLKKGELGLTDKQLKDWYKKRGFIFEGDSSYGYRPSKSEDVNKYKAKSYSAKSGEVTNENITDWSSPEDLKDAVRSGDIEKGFHENGADKLFYFDGNNIREVDNIDISYDFKNNKYKIQEQDAKEGKKENDSYFQELKEVKDSDTKQYWSVSEVPEGTDGTVVRVDGGAAFVKPDGDITGVFKDPDSKKKGVADNILKQAVKQGGKMLDNFDNYLTKVYQRNGFRIVSRTPFNEEFAPEGWNEAEHGKPDVVAMVYDPNNELDIEEKSFDDYDKAIEYRNSVLEKGSKQKIGKVKLSILASVGDEKAVRKGISDYINDLEKSGRITVNQSANWLKKLNNTDLASKKAVDEFLTDIEKGFKDAATKQKQSNVNSKVKRAGKMARGKSKVGQAAKALSKINAKKIEDENLLDEIEKIADDLLTKSPTTTVADINELLSKYNKEVAEQQKNTPQKSITEKIKDYKKKRAKAETFSQFINLEVERQQIIGEYLDSEQDIDPELVRELEEEIEIDIESNKITTAQLASQSRGNLTRAKNAIDKAVKDGVITEEKAEELNSKLKEQVDIFKKELDKFTVQESKKYKKSVLKLKGLTLDGVEADEVRLLLEAEKVDDAAWLSRFNDAAEAIIAGNIPFKEISDLREFAASKSKRVDKLVDAIEEIDPKGLSVKAWIDRLGTKEAAQRVRNILNSQRDEIYKMVYQPMSNAFTRAKKMSDTMLKDFLKASSPSIFRRDERGFNRVGIIAQYLREASLLGSGTKADGVEVGNRDIFGIWLGNEAAMDAAGLSESEKEYHKKGQAKSMWDNRERKNIEEFYESLPKTEEGYVDVQVLSENYESLLNPRERKMLKTAEEVFEKGRDRQEAANLRRGIEFNPQVYYVPTQRKGRIGDVDATTKKFDKFSPQAKQGKEKVTESLRPTFGVYPVNIAEMVINYAEDTSLDYVFSEVQPVTNAILNKTISRTKAGVIANAIKGDYNASLDYEKSIGNTPRMLTKLLGARYAKSLFDPIRSAIEIVAAFTSIPIKVRSARGIADTFNKESWDTLRELEDLTGADIADFKSGDIERRGVKEAVGRENIFIKVGRYTMSIPEYLTAITGFMPVFRREFQSITGESFDRKKFLNNKAYKEQNLQAIKDATAKAQELVERIYGSKTKGGTRRSVEIAPSKFLGIGLSEDGTPITFKADSPQGRLVSFFGNFGYREQGEFFQSLKFIAGDLRNKKGNNAAELANAGGVLMNAITYSYMMGVYYLASQIMFGDDDEAEEAEKRMEEMFTLKGLGDLITNQLTFLAVSKYGKVSRGAAIAVISALYNMAEDKEDKKILADLLKNNFFVNKPINLSSKYDVSVFTGKELLPAVVNLIALGATVNKSREQMVKEDDIDAVVAADLSIAIMNLSLAVGAGTQLPMSNIINKMLKKAKSKRKNNKKKPLTKKYNIN